jgi:hypothetical protein
MIAVGSEVFIARRASGSYIRMSRNLRIVRETKTRWVDELGGQWSKTDGAAYPMRENQLIVEVST